MKKYADLAKKVLLFCSDANRHTYHPICIRLCYEPVSPATLKQLTLCE